jgi:hypothetical protein
LTVQVDVGAGILSLGSPVKASAPPKTNDPIQNPSILTKLARKRFVGFMETIRIIYYLQTKSVEFQRRSGFVLRTERSDAMPAIPQFRDSLEEMPAVLW